MEYDVVTELLAILGRSLDHSFNVFDVMHHDTHEKQLSNVFAWLLDVGGSHQLGDTFLDIFIDEVNSARPPSAPLRSGRYRVQQEVNVGTAQEVDIADLVLDSATTRILRRVCDRAAACDAETC